MNITTVRFGEIEIDENKIITFEEGLPGFEECKNFILLEAEDSKMIYWLQAVQFPEIALCVLNVFKAIEDYAPFIPNDVFLELKANEEDLLALTVLVVPEKISEMTTNLLAPILINHNLNIGKQCILDKGDYSARHKVFGNLKELISQGA